MVKLMAVIVGLGVGLQEGVGDHEEVVSLSYPGRGIKVIPAAAAVDQAPVVHGSSFHISLFHINIGDARRLKHGLGSGKVDVAISAALAV